MSTSAITPRQAKFVDEYLVDGNGTQAATRAGYGAAGARVAAYRLLTNVAISSAIEGRRQAESARLAITRQNVLQQLIEAFGLARDMGQPAVMVSAARELGRLMGFYAPVQATVALAGDADSLQRQLSAMSDDELFRQIAEAEGP